jgi:hydrogenase maturation protein HypF
MEVFDLCDACLAEYTDSSDRRFHAEPNACPACGPQVQLLNRVGDVLETKDPIRDAVHLLLDGRIVAIRGVGGFHLAVDARNEDAVRLLRERKGREEKPLAVMARDLTTIRKICCVSQHEVRLLESASCPIVLLRSRATPDVAGSVAPDFKELGVMLPYAPLHHLLLAELDLLVMTSANYSEEPIVIGNQEAIRRLGSIADALLVHNREILQRCDDSVVRCSGEQVRLIRRSRGYAPAPISLKTALTQDILAVGGQLKNTVAVGRQEQVFLSQHIGDLDSPSAVGFFVDTIQHLSSVFEVEPNLIAHDLHPEYLSTKWAMARKDIPRVAVQHHHAHLAAALAENQIDGPAIGIVLDGTGMGWDGTIWGGEVLMGDIRSVQRFAWLSPFPLPGGEAAIREPWRTALGLVRSCLNLDLEELECPLMSQLDPRKLATVSKMLDRQLNTPVTSSCGRVFDAVSALLGVRYSVSYEAQAAIELELILDPSETGYYAAAVEENEGRGALSLSELLRAVLADLRRQEPPGRISSRFHWTLGHLFCRAAERARETSGINRVALTGGVFQNERLYLFMQQRLRSMGFEVVTHHLVPCNDGGLALGQVVVASALSETNHEVVAKE